MRRYLTDQALSYVLLDDSHGITYQLTHAGSYRVAVRTYSISL